MPSKRSNQSEPPPDKKPQPMQAPPGSKARLAELIRRQDAGEELFHEDDTKDMSHQQGQWEFLSPPGSPTNSLGAPRVFKDRIGMDGD
jgi:hypothetical protein